MKNKILSIIMLVIVLLISAGGSKTILSQQALTTDEMEAESVLMSYFDSLITGDTERIINLVGGDLLEKRTALLNNPNYSEFLRNMYSNAIFTIVGHKQIKENKVMINAEVLLSQGRVMRLEFLLVKQATPSDLITTFRIYDESECTNDSF